MKMRLVGILRAFALAGLISCPAMMSTGCAAMKGMESIGQMGEKLGAMIQDQGVIDKFASRMEGNFFNPGMETYVCMSSGLRLVGAHGEIDASATGTGTQLPTGVREALIGQLELARSPEERAAILTLLGWNRVESPHNPLPD